MAQPKFSKKLRENLGLCPGLRLSLIFGKYRSPLGLYGKPMPIMLAGMWCLSTGGRNASKAVVCMRVAWCLEDVSMRGLVVPIGGSWELYWEPWGIWGPWEPIREAVFPCRWGRGAYRGGQRVPNWEGPCYPGGCGFYEGGHGAYEGGPWCLRGVVSMRGSVVSRSGVSTGYTESLWGE